ncbi:hypothetical protein HYH03_014213 [Edaphochlamys debaryana]|uniref:Insulin-degrading enzyme n=1 Tax=Edaphochlamys debaryana TaxID=47281 RepID=A0A835XUF4_9CHLO|nr:hypothetical protein HYH03_014213 [Edaphochlamys debaryana]|eukprot:KAG2487100.1 hypothetical protein HYH03_014213 [Edaphochlamys debaryana]
MAQPDVADARAPAELAEPCPALEGSAILRPANDDMEYKYLVLPNSLRVLLVSDPTADKAGAAMDVCVGSISDPDAFPGLAHFTEHMLFYSSEKYPVEDEYTKFVSDRGGSTNAYTSAEHTNYHFDVNADSLAPALDRFAQFFIAPTISADGIEREVKAVDSEHGKNLSSDAWRKSQVNKTTANSRHPWARFSTGNRDTLFVAPKAAGRDPRDAVVSFHAEQYSADRCCLAVMGRQALGELEALVRDMFSAVPNKALSRPQFEADVFLPEHVGLLLRIVPVREGQTLELVWQVPPSERLYREQPLGYVSHLLGHEGEGSVFALLKSRGWASALWAGESGGSLSFASFFTVHIELTEEGQRHIREVATAVFRYIALLRSPGGISPRIWEEVRGLAQLQFDTRDKTRPFSYTTSLANGLQHYPPEDLLPALYGVPRVFAPEVIAEALAALTPERVRVFWISKAHEAGAEEGGKEGAAKEAPVEADGVERDGAEAAKAPEAEAGAAGEAEAEADSTHCVAADRSGAAAEEPAGPGAASSAAAAAASSAGGMTSEPIYGTRYGVGPLPADWLAEWAAARPEDEPGLRLPAPNPFIPTDLTLASDEAAAAPPLPAVALAVPGVLRLWHRPETRFGQPKAVLYLDVQSPEAYTSPRAAVLTRLFVKLMLDYLNEVAYPAQQAGLDYNLLNTQSGWQLLLSGYNHKLHMLLGEVLARLADFKVLPDRFEFVREGLVREYANQLHNQPYSWAMYRAELLTTARRWPLEAYGALAAEVTAEELGAFVKRLNSRVFVEGLCAGNMRKTEALRCGGLLLQVLRDRLGSAPLHPAEAAELRVLRVPPPPAASASAPSSSGEAAPAEAGSGPVRPCLGGGWLFTEAHPSGRDDNSAAVVMYQRGPDEPRSNALAQLLVQLAKRDAFYELRTRQQLGYIVSLHGGTEHGVGYTELLVQSNSHDAADCCRRMAEFVARLVDTELPAKCGLAPAPTTTSAPAPAEAGAATPPAAEAEGSGATEFETAVAELAKTKLEKPKKLGDLANRWWSEVQHGSYLFDRQEVEVAALRKLTPAELLEFARGLLAAPGGAGKLSVQIRGKAEAARAAAPAEASSGVPDAAAGPASTSAADGPAPAATSPEAAPAPSYASLPYAVIPTADPFAWKRRCEAWPSVRSLWAARREAAGEAPPPAALGEAEALEAAQASLAAQAAAAAASAAVEMKA